MDLFNGCPLVQLKKNRLINKRISNIYLKVTIDQDWHTQNNFNFVCPKSSSHINFWGVPTMVAKFGAKFMFLYSEKKFNIQKKIFIIRGNFIIFTETFSYSEEISLYSQKHFHNQRKFHYIHRNICYSKEISLYSQKHFHIHTKLPYIHRNIFTFRENFIIFTETIFLLRGNFIIFTETFSYSEEISLHSLKHFPIQWKFH